MSRSFFQVGNQLQPSITQLENPSQIWEHIYAYLPFATPSDLTSIVGRPGHLTLFLVGASIIADRNFSIGKFTVSVTPNLDIFGIKIISICWKSYLEMII